MRPHPERHVARRSAGSPGRVAALVALMACLVAAGCSAERSDGSGPGQDTSSTSGSIVVSAAASLTDSFTTIRDDFVEARPGAEVTLNFGSSGALANQIGEGAPADVAAFADTTPMASLDDAGLLADDPTVFAGNRLVIVTAPGNPADITDVADLADVGVVSLCVETAPCGRFADRVLAEAGVAIAPTSVSRGTDARATLTAVAEGDAVAAIVYVTDATAAGDRVDTVDIPDADNVTARYPIAVLEDAANPDLASAFRSYVLSDEGQAVLRAAGFMSP